MKNKAWKNYLEKRRELFNEGLIAGKIRPYDIWLIERLRKVYQDGLPGSVILLSHYFTEGQCRKSIHILSEALYPVCRKPDEDLRIVYAKIKSIELNPEYSDKQKKDPHCFLERTKKSGIEEVYDTTTGLIYDKGLFYELEEPEIILEHSKETIKRFIKDKKKFYPNTEKREYKVYAALNSIPKLEEHINDPKEFYANESLQWLQKEVELFKESISYDEIKQELETNKRLELKPNKKTELK